MVVIALSMHVLLYGLALARVPFPYNISSFPTMSHIHLHLLVRSKEWFLGEEKDKVGNEDYQETLYMF